MSLTKCIQVDPLGEIQMGEEPLKNLDVGSALLKSFHMKGSVCCATVEAELIHVEAQSFPLVVQKVFEDDGELLLEFNYVYQENFKLDKGLYLNDWSQICGFTNKGVPFVFSKEAQAVFSDQIVETSSYESFSFKNKEYEMEDWYVENTEVQKADSWSGRYVQSDTPWDLGGPHPCIDWTLPRLKLSKSKFLVAGCGLGHDAAKLKSLGHPTTGLDFSKEAIDKAKALYQDVPFLHSDLFVHEKEFEGHYDVVFEHTLFCAVDPGVRAKLVRTWHNLLSDKGHLIGVFNVCNKRSGPPFGVSEWELEQLLEKYFKIDYWGRLRGQESARPGKELFVFAQKK